MAKEGIAPETNLPSQLLELIGRNNSVSQTLDVAALGELAGYPGRPVAHWAVVVTQVGHHRFGEIGQIVWSERKFGELDRTITVRFFNNKESDFTHFPSKGDSAVGKLAYLDKTLLTKADKKLITAVVLGEDLREVEKQIIYPCAITIDSLRLYLANK